MSSKETKLKEFWRKNLSLITVLLTVWFVASYGIVILLGDLLCNVNFFGCTLSFWFGQQGSILTFITLIVIYAVKMDRISEKFEQSLEEEKLIQKEGA